MKMGAIAATIAGSISNGGGLVVVNADGSVNVTPASGTGVLLGVAPPATANKGLLSLGNGPFDGVSAGHFTGVAGGTIIAANAASGYSGDLLRLAIAGSTKLYIDSFGSIYPAAVVTGNTFVNTVRDFGGSGGSLSMGADGSVMAHANSALPAAIPLISQGSALQTADLYRAQDSAQHAQFGIANVGSGASPVWALRVRATANAESMAQAHVAGANTGRAIQFVDDTGVSLGWLNLTS